MDAIREIRSIAGKQCFVSGMSALVTDLKDLCEQMPIRPSAQPIPIFLLEPPKPPCTWPLKWVSTSMES